MKIKIRDHISKSRKTWGESIKQDLRSLHLKAEWAHNTLSERLNLHGKTGAKPTTTTTTTTMMMMIVILYIQQFFKSYSSPKIWKCIALHLWQSRRHDMWTEYLVIQRWRRPRRHDRKLIDKTAYLDKSSFIVRMLYKDSYWITF